MVVTLRGPWVTAVVGGVASRGAVMDADVKAGVVMAVVVTAAGVAYILVRWRLSRWIGMAGGIGALHWGIALDVGAHNNSLATVVDRLG